MDDTRHITKDQYDDIILQLEELTGSDNKENNRSDDIKKCIKTILDILCLEAPDDVNDKNEEPSGLYDFVITTNAIVPMPVFIKADSFEDAFKKCIGDYEFKEVDRIDYWDVKIVKYPILHDDDIKYYYVKTG